MMRRFSPYSGVFRIKDWWWSKAALLMGLIYLFAAWYHISFEKFIPLAILSLITITGFAGIGYLFNDLFDIEKDTIAGKRNFLAGKSGGFILVLFLLSSIFVLTPWLFLPKSAISYALIATQLFLFIIYSVPPIRLKERGLAGIITDALYAHGLPSVLAAYTFALAAQYSFPLTELIFLFAWQTVSGVRNILLHLAEDVEADKKAGSKNFVAGLHASQFQLILAWLIAIEWLLCLVFFASLLSVNPLFAICLLVILGLSATGFMLFTEKSAPQFLSSTWSFFPNNIYEKWLPLAYLMILSVGDIRFAILLFVHLTAFNFDFYLQAADRIKGRWESISFKGNLITVRIILSYPANYFIYYLLRIFGVDLKQENISAIEYFKKRFGSRQSVPKPDK
jgi:4-hydroxybenzoate polyprenyltransferase